MQILMKEKILKELEKRTKIIFQWMKYAKN